MLPRPPVTTSDAATSVTDPVGRSSSGVACCVVGGNKASGGGLAPCLDDELAELSGVDRRQLDADPAVAADRGRDAERLRGGGDQGGLLLVGRLDTGLLAVI
jgi:hypothetical protein